MHAYRILLPSETNDSRFNSREKHMLTDSVQPYNKPIINLAFSVCTVKYQTSDFSQYWSVWYFTVQTSRTVWFVSLFSLRNINSDIVYCLRAIIFIRHKTIERAEVQIFVNYSFFKTISLKIQFL
jgi:hypothetical protein